MKGEKLKIVDTSLRDGEQRAGLAFSQKRKIAFARLLDELGIYQIEAGIPSMGKTEKDTINAIKCSVKTSLVSAWCRMSKADLDDAFVCNPDIVHISIPVSDLQIKTKLRKDRKFVAEKTRECCEYAAERGFKVTLGFEDASRADKDFLLFMSGLAKKLGVKRIRYADTVGIAMPHKIASDIKSLKKSGLEIEMHAHDDLGLAVANTVEAAKNGALFVDTTFFGIGERAGNCNLKKLAAAVQNIFDLGISTGSREMAEVEKRVCSILLLDRFGDQVINGN